MGRWYREIAVGLGLFAPFLSSCAALGGVAAGPAYAVGKEHQSAGVLNTYLGAGLGDATVSVGGGGELRVKVGPSVGHVAFGPFFFFFSGGPADVAKPFLRFGFNLLQFESVESRFAFGMFSPRIEGGVIFRITDDLGFSLAADTEYVVRFTDTPNTGYLALVLGLALSETHKNAPRFSRGTLPAPAQ